MIAEVGHYALVLALGLAVIQGVAPIIGARLRDDTLMAVAGPTALAQFAPALKTVGETVLRMSALRG